jgi:predicted AAA+ superfamily ATPase
MKEQLRRIVRQKVIDGLAADVPAFTRRDVWMPSVPGKAIAVIGMRRAGKTTLLWQVLSDRLDEGAAREGLLYFGFEDERLADMGAEDLDLLVQEYYRLHPEWRERRKATLLLDEIQTVPGWERFARRLMDDENVDLFVSGSSARLLSREVATSMRGRAMEATVFPFSFREFLRHAGKEPPRENQGLTKAQVSFSIPAFLRQ